MSNKVAKVVLEVDNSPEVLAALEEKKEVILEALGLQAENYAKLKCPVDTGLLRNSITHVIGRQSVDPSSHSYAASNPKPGQKSAGSYSGTMSGNKDTVYIGTNVEYAAYVELGTQKTKAQPFLKPAVADHKAEYEHLIKDILDGNL